MTRWRLTYQPCGEPDVREFAGTKAEMDQWFLENCLCAHCKEEAIAGEGAALDEHGKEVFRYEVSGPWATGCGCEWEYEEIAQCHT